MNQFFSSRNLRLAVIIFSLFGVFCFGKNIFHFIIPQKDVVVPLAMMKQIENSLARSNIEIKMEIEKVTNDIIDLMEKDPGKSIPWYIKSDSVSKILDRFTTYIHSLKKTASDNWEIEIQDRINKSNAALLNLIDDPSFKRAFRSSFPLFQLEDSLKEYLEITSQSGSFFITTLEMIESKALITEHAMKLFFLSRATPTSCGPINKVMAKVIADKNIVHLGKDFKSVIFLTDYFSYSNYKIHIGKLKPNLIKNDWGEFDSVRENPFVESKEIEIINGLGRFKEKASSLGIHKYTGAIEDKDSVYYPFEAEYEVIK